MSELEHYSPGNYATVSESIYFHDADGVWVNLFIASQLNWESKGVRIRQETAWPEQASTRLTVEAGKPTAFAMRLRIPSWTRKPVVKINGRPIAEKVRQGTYLEINRTWTKGDTVEFDMPMHLWAWPMPDDERLVAVMYGPMVLAGKLNDGRVLPENLVYLANQPFYKKVQMPDEWFAKAPEIVTDDVDPSAWIKPVHGKTLTFRTDGVGRPEDITLIPYHRLFGERYVVYLRVVSPERQPTQHSEHGKELQWYER